MKDDFSSSVSTMNGFAERDLAPKFPTSSTTSAGGIQQNKWTAKYAKFVLDEAGNAQLEAIMDDVLAGKKLLAEEKWYFTKDGDSVIVIKYLIPQDVPKKNPNDPIEIKIPGRRRQRKALIKKEGEP